MARNESDERYVQEVFVKPLKDLARARVGLYVGRINKKAFGKTNTSLNVKVNGDDIHIRPAIRGHRLGFVVNKPELLESMSHGAAGISVLRVKGDGLDSLYSVTKDYHLYDSPSVGMIGAGKPYERIALEDYEDLLYNTFLKQTA